MVIHDNRTNAIVVGRRKRAHLINFLALVAFSLQLMLLTPDIAHAQGERSLMGLISTRDIAEITQLATDLAAQTMNSNAEMLSKPGRPEVRPISLNQSPSEMLGQSLTNIWQPASQQLASQLTKNNNNAQSAMTSQLSTSADEMVVPVQRRASETFKPLANSPNGAMKALLSLGGIRTPTNKDDTYNSDLEASGSSMRGLSQRGVSSQTNAMNSIMELASTFLGGGTGAGGSSDNTVQSRQPLYDNSNNAAGGGESGMSRLLSMAGGTRNKAGSYQMPSLRQFLPMADRNFGFDQGEGCLPFVGEFMKIAYGNCVKQADQRTWDTWGKEIQNALMGGKIDLLKASRETCKKGAEREQCGQIRRAVSDCDIIGSIQLVTNMQRSISRCDEISGIIDQNPTTVLSQMNGLINGEMAQGFINNFLG